jgi:ABC-type branched-subunit amino acid transport system ATPase component
VSPDAKPTDAKAPRNGALLHAEGLVAGYVPEVDILTGVEMAVSEGEIVTIVGPNGAGKSTLIKSIFGLLPPRKGKVTLRGEDLTGLQPHSITRRGMSYVPQLDNVFQSLSVEENLEMGALERGNAAERMAVMYELFPRLGERRTQAAGTMSGGERQMLAMGRALMPEPQVLLLDEPSAGLNESETQTLGTLLRELSGTGLGVLLVEHDMSFVMGTCEHIQVLDFGRLIASGDPHTIQGDPGVRAAYLGTDSEREERVAKSPKLSVAGEGDDEVKIDTSGAVLALEDVNAGYGTISVLEGVDLAVMPGQVYALLGPNGAGKSTTLKVASGQIAPSEGKLLLLGDDVTGTPSDTLARRGVCLVPEGRGVFPNLTVLENLRMATYSGTPYDEVLDRSFERFPRLGERRKQVAGTLSGGEQQMLAMARGLAINPKVLLLDELSMGLAPLIVEELYEVVKNIATDDVSILVVEQFAHEVLGVADVAAIMLHGRIEYRGDPVEVGAALESAYLGGTVE